MKRRSLARLGRNESSAAEITGSATRCTDAWTASLVSYMGSLSNELNICRADLRPGGLETREPQCGFVQSWALKIVSKTTVLCDVVRV